MPLAFAVGIFIISDGLTRAVVLASFSPLVASVAYLGWRAYVTGDLKKPPRGWLSSPGRKVYEKTWKSNEKRMERTAQATRAVEAFNEFASKHDISTLTEPTSLMTPDPERLKEELKSIHEYEARELSGDAYTEYMKCRRTVLKEL